jgi:predicted Zn-ribbon and HTH transcriptional regulator
VPDRPSQRPYNVRYYQRNRQREIDRVMTRQRARLEFLRELRKVPCKDCGCTYLPHQMDFDHRDPATKSFGLTGSRAMLAPQQRLLEEIAKCDIVCANCHAVRTYALQGERKAWRRANGGLVNTKRRITQREKEIKRRDFILTLRERPCEQCGVRFPPFIMQFDHRDPRTKKFILSGTWMSSEARILKEAAKCDIVCPNCHRDRTLRRRQATAGVAQLAEHEFSKLRVAGSSPVSRSDQTIQKDVRRRLLRRLISRTSRD